MDAYVLDTFALMAYFQSFSYFSWFICCHVYNAKNGAAACLGAFSNPPTFHVTIKLLLGARDAHVKQPQAFLGVLDPRVKRGLAGHIVRHLARVSVIQRFELRDDLGFQVQPAADERPLAPVRVVRLDGRKVIVVHAHQVDAIPL